MVSTQVTTVSNCKKELKITVPEQEISVIREEQFKIVQKEAEIQGFRKGRAPKHLVKQYYQGTIERYTLDEAMQRGYEEGIRESKVMPIAEPVVKKFNFDDEKNLVMEVEVETYPEIELKKYKGIKLEKDVYKISSEDVAESLEYLKRQKAVVTPVEDDARDGHYMTVTMQEVDEAGLPIVGKKYEDIRFKLGEDKFDSDIEKQLVGLKPGEEKLIEKKYDDTVAQKNLVGKTERFKVTVQKIENEDLPELSDEFVRDLNYEGIETLAQLKERIQNNLEAQWGQESEQAFYHQFVHELLQLNPFDVPESVVERYLDDIVDDIRKRDNKLDEETVRKNYRTDAMFNIKWFYLKDKIATTENIKAEEEDFQKYLENIKEENVKKMYSENAELKKRVMSDVFEKKVFDFLVDNSKINIKEKSIRKDTD